MFRRFIAIPFGEGGERCSLASHRLSLLIDSVCIRRTRELLDLPEGLQRVRIVEFTQAERDQYEHTKAKMNRAIRQRAGEFNNKSMFGMFQAQLQLRILCNHGTFQQHFSWARARRDVLDEREDTLCSIGRNGEANCSSCGQHMPILSSKSVHRKSVDGCTHIFCTECLEVEARGPDHQSDTVTECPLCSLGKVLAADEVGEKHVGTNARDDDYFRAEGHSSKMMALIRDVREDLWAKKR